MLQEDFNRLAVLLGCILFGLYVAYTSCTKRHKRGSRSSLIDTFVNALTPGTEQGLCDWDDASLAGSNTQRAGRPAGFKGRGAGPQRKEQQQSERQPKQHQQQRPVLQQQSHQPASPAIKMGTAAAITSPPRSPVRGGAAAAFELLDSLSLSDGEDEPTQLPSAADDNRDSSKEVPAASTASAMRIVHDIRVLDKANVTGEAAALAVLSRSFLGVSVWDTVSKKNRLRVSACFRPSNGVDHENEVLGFVVHRLCSQTWQVLYLGVAETERRKGVGHSLVRGIRSLAKKEAFCLSIMVLVPEPAAGETSSLNFWRATGFSKGMAKDLDPGQVCLKIDVRQFSKQLKKNMERAGAGAGSVSLLSWPDILDDARRAKPQHLDIRLPAPPSPKLTTDAAPVEQSSAGEDAMAGADDDELEEVLRLSREEYEASEEKAVEKKGKAKKAKPPKVVEAVEPSCAEELSPNPASESVQGVHKFDEELSPAINVDGPDGVSLAGYYVDEWDDAPLRQDQHVRKDGTHASSPVVAAAAQMPSEEHDFSADKPAVARWNPQRAGNATWRPVMSGMNMPDSLPATPVQPDKRAVAEREAARATKDGAGAVEARREAALLLRNTSARDGIDAAAHAAKEGAAVDKDAAQASGKSATSPAKPARDMERQPAAVADNHSLNKTVAARPRPVATTAATASTAWRPTLRHH